MNSYFFNCSSIQLLLIPTGGSRSGGISGAAASTCSNLYPSFVGVQRTCSLAQISPSHRINPSWKGELISCTSSAPIVPLAHSLCYFPC